MEGDTKAWQTPSVDELHPCDDRTDGDNRHGLHNAMIEEVLVHEDKPLLGNSEQDAPSKINASNSTSYVQIPCGKDYGATITSSQGHYGDTELLGKSVLEDGYQFSKSMPKGLLTPQSARRVEKRTKTLGYIPRLSPLLFQSFIKSPEVKPKPAEAKEVLPRRFPAVKRKKSFIEDISDRFPLTGAAFNLCSATLGAGVLSLPYAFAQCGIVVAIILLLLAGQCTIVSIDLLVKSSSLFPAYKFRKTGELSPMTPASYEAMTVGLFGNKAGYFVEGCIILFCFGTAVAYIVAVGDILEGGVIGALPSSRIYFMESRESAMIAFWIFVMFPLSLFEKINSLRCASLFGISAIFFLVFVICVQSIEALVSRYSNRIFDGPDLVGDVWWENDGHGNKVSLWPTSISGVLKACPIIMFAFSCQVNVISIYEELEEPTLKRMHFVSKSAVCTCLSVYILAGTFGYVEFGSGTMDNILQNFCVGVTGDPLVIAAFLSITITVVMAFPLNIFPCRYTMDIILRRCCTTQSSRQPPTKKRQECEKIIDENDSSVKSSALGINKTIIRIEDASTKLATSNNINSKTKHVLLTFFISGLALFIALIVPNISVVFSLMGGTTSCIINFILPGMFALKLGVHGIERGKTTAFVLIIGGALIGILSTGVTIYGLTSSPDQQSKQYDYCAYLVVPGQDEN